MLQETGSHPNTGWLDRKGVTTLEYAIIAGAFVAFAMIAIPPLAQKVAELLGSVQF